MRPPKSLTSDKAKEPKIYMYRIIEIYRTNLLF